MADTTNRPSTRATQAEDAKASTEAEPTAGTKQTAEAKKPLVVLAPLVATKDSAGRILYLYRGTPMPEGTPQAEIERLAEMELIGEDDGSAAPGVGASRE